MKRTFLDLLVHLIAAEKISRRRALYPGNRVELRERAIRVLFLDNYGVTFVIVEAQEVHHFCYFEQSYIMCDAHLKN